MKESYRVRALAAHHCPPGAQGFRASLPSDCADRVQLLELQRFSCGPHSVAPPTVCFYRWRAKQTNINNVCPGQ